MPGRQGQSCWGTYLAPATGLAAAQRQVDLGRGWREKTTNNPVQRRFSAAHRDYTRNEEPSLDELHNEPIIRLLLARDGVEVKTLQALLLIAAGVHGRP